MNREGDDSSTVSSTSYADTNFRDAGEEEQDLLDKINIREARDSSSSFEDEFPEVEGPFPPTNLVLRLNPSIRPETINWLVEKILAKKNEAGGAELLVMGEPPRNAARDAGREADAARDAESVVLHVTANIFRFLEVAECLELKKVDEKGLLREFQLKDLDDFLHGDILLDQLITPAEKQLIVLNELQNIRALPGEAHVPGYPELVLHSGQSIFEIFVSEHLILNFYPLHDAKQLKSLLNTNWIWAFWNPEPFEEVRRYFGESVTLYFTFSSYYTSCLLLPTLISILLWIFPEAYLDKKTSIVLFSTFNLIYTTIILKLWQRKCSELSYIWGTFRTNPWEVEPRLKYKGKMAIDPVTGQYRPMYPGKKTGFKLYFVSWPIVLLCMWGAFMTCLYYFRAVEALKTWKDQYQGTLWGRILELTPSIFYAVIVAIMNQYYRRLIQILTEWENHRTELQYDEARVAKLVGFEFVNNFMSFIYIGFVLNDLALLKKQLLIMLFILHFLVVLQEIIVPVFVRETSSQMLKFLDRTRLVSLTRFRRNSLLVARNSRIRLFGVPGALIKGPPTVSPTATPIVPSKLKFFDPKDPRVEMSRLEGKMESTQGSFDAYLIIFIQFGYVFLFSPVFPSGICIALLTNLIIIWANVYKLCCVYQRPIPKRQVKDIGSWQDAFELMGYISVMTNCALIAIVVDLRAWAIFQRYSDVAAEHLLILIKLGINKVTPNVPSWVNIATARLEYKGRVAFRREQQKHSRRRQTHQFQILNLHLREMADKD